MISTRMLEIINYLKSKEISTYKEIASEINIKDRYIRYDIERINDILRLKNLPMIEKQSKGVLIFPKELDISELIGFDSYVYSQNERVDIMKLILLINDKKFNISKLSKDFDVSRTTIKNDMSVIEAQLSDKDILIEYTDHFFLSGPKENRVDLLNYELKKYIDLIKSKDDGNLFEQYVIKVINESYKDISLKNIVVWIEKLLESMNCILTDDSYKWYVSNILVLIWFIQNNKKHPLEDTEIKKSDMKNFEPHIKELEDIIGNTIDSQKTRVIIRLFNYTRKYANVNEDVNLINVESAVYKLITLMSKEMDIKFEEDEILVEGLLNHIEPLLKRVKAGINMCEDVVSILSEKDMEVFVIVKKIIKEIDILKNIKNDDEITYLAIHFIASQKRLANLSRKKIVLVCGLGYGTSTMLKESLMNEYNVYIVDIIPEYKIANYSNWDDIDFIISTTKLKPFKSVKVINVNPILNDNDYLTLDSCGIPRKKVLSNYYSLNRKLGFLSDEDRKHVMKIIQDELGYKDIKPGKSIKTLTDLLKYDCVKIIDKSIEWKEAVKKCTEILEDKGYIDKRYGNNIIDVMNTAGFYSINDDSFAMLHGSSTDGIVKSCMSLVINKKPVIFGDKRVNVIFCLASKDKKEHIPAVISLTRMIKNSNLIEKLKTKETEEDIYKTLIECEREEGI